jgi:hypothetical protein
METTTAVHPSLTSVAVNTCPVCTASLAEDQRYCVECGERCGGPRLPAPHEKAAAVAERASSRRRVSAGTTLVAGVATLLLAMGVGILIGRENKTTAEPTAARSPVQVVTVGGGAAAAAGAAAGAAGAAQATTTHKAGSAKRKSATKKASSAAAVNKILKPTKKAGKLPPAAVKLGSKGSGRGYKNGKFTGDFFGGGN